MFVTAAPFAAVVKVFYLIRAPKTMDNVSLLPMAVPASSFGGDRAGVDERAQGCELDVSTRMHGNGREKQRGAPSGRRAVLRGGAERLGPKGG